MSKIHQVAALAGVSIATVSHVINNTRFVSDETRKRVQAAMEEIGYQPNALARSLRRGETKTLGVILPDSSNPYFAEIGRGLELLAFNEGYSIILCNSENDAENFARCGLISLAGQTRPLYISNKTNYGVIYKIDVSTEQGAMIWTPGAWIFPVSTREMR